MCTQCQSHEMIICRCLERCYVDVKHVFSHGLLVLPHVHGCLAVQSTRASLCVGLWSSQGFVKQADLRAVLDAREVEEEDELPMDWDAIRAV